jgi:hypothetical protein
MKVDGIQFQSPVEKRVIAVLETISRSKAVLDMRECKTLLSYCDLCLLY